jgi:hypothetical protein
MPVVLVYLEKLEGTMDSLLELQEYAPITTKEQESQWAAWLFQVCVAMNQLQSFLHLTHNDLHTNNIVWKRTDQTHIQYKDTRGRIWNIPTYGRLFSIIDYGRSIFILKGYTCISSDYDDGNDAAGMYNFGPIEDSSKLRVMPNKSFDLCRLSCSLLRALYPRNPISKPKGAILTKEGSWEVRETDEKVFNLLWTWIKTKDKKNVLETEYGKEQHPGFELYTMIAKYVCDAIPENQFNNSVFQQFLSTNQSVDSTKQYIHVPL